MCEKIWQEDDKHVRGLIGLNNPNLSSFSKADTPYWIVSVYFLFILFFGSGAVVPFFGFSWVELRCRPLVSFLRVFILFCLGFFLVPDPGGGGGEGHILYQEHPFWPLNNETMTSYDVLR